MDETSRFSPATQTYLGLNPTDVETTFGTKDFGGDQVDPYTLSSNDGTKDFIVVPELEALFPATEASSPRESGKEAENSDIDVAMTASDQVQEMQQLSRKLAEARKAAMASQKPKEQIMKTLMETLKKVNPDLARSLADTTSNESQQSSNDDSDTVTLENDKLFESEDDADESIAISSSTDRSEHFSENNILDGEENDVCVDISDLTKHSDEDFGLATLVDVEQLPGLCTRPISGANNDDFVSTNDLIELMAGAHI